MNILADHQPFTLVKHWGMGGIMVRTIGTPGHNNTNRRFHLLHRADLQARYGCVIPGAHRRHQGANKTYHVPDGQGVQAEYSGR